MFVKDHMGSPGPVPKSTSESKLPESLRERFSGDAVFREEPTEADCLRRVHDAAIGKR